MILWQSRRLKVYAGWSWRDWYFGFGVDPRPGALDVTVEFGPAYLFADVRFDEKHRGSGQ